MTPHPLFDDPTFNDRLFFPRRDSTPTPTGAIDVVVEVPGATLHLRWHRPHGTKATVLLFHGNGEVVADYDDIAPMYARSGAALAVVDFRGYGSSTGKPTLRTLVTDATCVLDALTSRLTGGPLLVMGRSLGAVCANELYGKRPKEVAGFILESGATDLEAMARRRGFELRHSANDELDVFDPLPKLRRGDHPLLVLHGANDTLIRPIEGEAAFAAAGTTEKYLVLVPGLGHNDLSLSPTYWEALTEFVAKRSEERMRTDRANGR